MWLHSIITNSYGKRVYIKKEHKEHSVSSVEILLPGDFDLNSVFWLSKLFVLHKGLYIYSM